MRQDADPSPWLCSGRGRRHGRRRGAEEYGSAAIGVSRALTTAAEDGHVDAAFLFGDLSYAVGYGERLGRVLRADHALRRACLC